MGMASEVVGGTKEEHWAPGGGRGGGLATGGAGGGLEGEGGGGGRRPHGSGGILVASSMTRLALQAVSRTHSAESAYSLMGRGYSSQGMKNSISAAVMLFPQKGKPLGGRGQSGVLRRAFLAFATYSLYATSVPSRSNRRRMGEPCVVAQSVNRLYV